MATSESIVEQPKVHRYSIVDYDDLTVFQEGVSTKEQDRPFIEDRDVSSESTRAIMPSAVNDVVPLGAKSTTEICESILGVLERYRQPCKSDSDKKTWPAKAVFSIQVEKFVLKSEPVRMVLPAFPFKSPNKKIKVLGRLPDKGEEVALALMEGLCRAIEDVYVPGARVDIVSDGLMYNDILGVSDEEVWSYGQAFRQLSQDTNCRHLDFARLHDLIDDDNIHEPATEEDYLRNAPKYRDEIIRKYLPVDFDPVEFIAKDFDATCTFRGYIKFLETDFTDNIFEGKLKTKSQIKRYHEDVARSMIIRGKAFAASIASKLPNHVRLSIHPSSETSKLSMSLIPQQGRCHTPWHAALVRALDGSITMTHAALVPASTHDLVIGNGRPSYFRERCSLFDWPNMDIKFDYSYPCGITVRARDESFKYSLRDMPMQKIHGLAEECSPVVLRGFENTRDVGTFEPKAKEAGEIAPWTFGIRQVIKDSGSRDRQANKVTSAEAMPMHYGGFFFFKKEMDEIGVERSVPKVPRFQYFSAVSPSPPNSVFTLFASSQLFFRNLPAQCSIDEHEKLTWTCRSSRHWDSRFTDPPLIIPHPTNGKPCLRWHEPWAASKTKFSHSESTIENGPQDYHEVINSLLYDRRVCLYFSIQKGDILVADNISMMHTRTAFESDSDRKLWRIQFN